MRDERARLRRPSQFFSAGGGPTWRRPLFLGRLRTGGVNPSRTAFRDRLEWDAVGVVHWPTNVP